MKFQIPDVKVAVPEEEDDTETVNAKATAEAEAFAKKCLDAVLTRQLEFEKGWWVQAEKAEKIYAADDIEKMELESPYNILYSNTEVLQPALYSATPKPDVRSRYRDQNLKPLPELVERYLRVASDPQSPGGDCFDNAMQDAVLSSLVPGMGYVRIRYVEDRSFPITFESGHFKTLIWGKATRWAKVPWVCFAHPMTRQTMQAQFNLDDAEMAESYKPTSEAEDEKDDCIVYEFWDRKTKKVYFLAEEWGKTLLKPAADDPLGLENFYPTPGLLTLTLRNGKTTPIPLYNYYRNQAEELNRVTGRLQKVLSAIKVRGFYNPLLGDDLKKLLSSDEMDNAMVPAGEAGLLAQTGLDKQIWMMPIENLMTVAKELYSAREAIKQVIYELTGISDIIRGSSVASETATAQDLKNKWGTVRLRRMQAVVANYARDLFRMCVDCSADHVPPSQWNEITQLAIPTAVEQQQAKTMLQQQAMQAQQQMPPPQMPQPGQPPAPPPQAPPPDPKLLKTAQGPNIEQVLAKIKGDQNRSYFINIETSSTIDLDTAQDKGEVTEFMQSLGQLMPALGPLTELGPTGLEAAKAILINVCARFKFGIEISDAINNIQPPPPAQPSPADQATQQAQQHQAQADSAAAQAKIQQIALDGQVGQAKAQFDLKKLQADSQKLDLDIQAAQLRVRAQAAKLREVQSTGSIKVSSAQSKADINQQLGNISLEQAKEPPEPNEPAE